MGLFKDFATSNVGTFTTSFLTEADRVAQRDAEINAVISSNALKKEVEAFRLTETAFKNRKQIVNIIKSNPEKFQIVPGELTVEQIADRLVGKAFNNQRSMFEHKDFDKLKTKFANWMARNPGEGIDLTNPYVTSQNLFNREKELHSARLSAISKTPKSDRLLHKISQAEERVESPEILTDKAMKIAAVSAQAYGILNTFPGTLEGQVNLQFMKTNIIVAYAKAQFPNDDKA